MPRSESRPAPPALPPHPDPVVRAYLRDVDRTLLRENLRRTPTQRVQNLMALQALYEEARRAGYAVLSRALEALAELEALHGERRERDG